MSATDLFRVIYLGLRAWWWESELRVIGHQHPDSAKVAREAVNARLAFDDLLSK